MSINISKNLSLYLHVYMNFQIKKNYFQIMLEFVNERFLFKKGML